MYLLKAKNGCASTASDAIMNKINPTITKNGMLLEFDQFAFVNGNKIIKWQNV